MEVASIVALAVGVSTLVTFGGTRLWDAYRMEKKYVTLEAFEMCHENREKVMSEIAESEGAIVETLESLTKRLQLGNLIMWELCTKAGVDQSRIKGFEKALGIELNSFTKD